MQTALEYLEKHNLRAMQPMPVWDAVYRQAIQHTRRLKRIDLLEVNRPNESQRIKEYRNEIARRLTREGVYKFIAKTSRIYKNSGVNVDAKGISATLLEWLNSRPFRFNGRQLNFSEYIYEVVTMHAIEDPNALHVAFPINPQNVQVNPSAPVDEGGLRSNEQIGILPLIIPSKQRRVLTDEVVAWQHGEWAFGNNNASKAPYYFISDKQEIYIHYPTRYEGGEVVYETELWYRHQMDMLPAQSLMGLLSVSEQGEIYNESFMAAFFEYADEFVTAFSDSQAVRVQHSYPKVVLDDLPCPANCRNGKVFDLDKNGKQLITECSVCKGTGIVNDIGPYSVLRRPQGMPNAPERANDTPVEYLEMPEAALRFGHEVAFELLDKGKRAVGLDILESLAESGVAKEARLEDLIDYLTMIGNSQIYFMETFLAQCEALLVVTPSNRVKPTVMRPNSYAIRTQQMLLEDAKNAIGSDRVQKAKEYFKTAYKGQDKLVRAMGLAHDYAPLLGLEGQDLQTRLNFAYGPADLVKADRAVWAFTKLTKTQPNFLGMSDEQLFALADELIAPFIQAEMPLSAPETGTDGTNATDGADGAETGGEFATGPNTKLLESVGGVTGIIQISSAVAKGEMTEAAGESVLVEIYGLPAAVAAKLVEVPEATINKNVAGGNEA
jgi:hypothetical protein